MCTIGKCEIRYQYNIIILRQEVLACFDLYSELSCQVVKTSWPKEATYVVDSISA